MKKLTYLITISLALLLFASCKHDDLTAPKPNENIRPAGDFLKNNYELRLFYAAVEKTGYAEQLNGAGPFTVLAPTNEAFNDLGIFEPADFDKMNADSLKMLIGYHLLPRRLRISDIPVNGVDLRYATLEGSQLYTSLASYNRVSPMTIPNHLFFSGSQAERKDVVLANGTLHVLSSVMKPNFTKTTQRWLADHPDYSVFVKGLKKFNLWDQLAGAAQFTIFAPDNKALSNVGISDATLDIMDASQYLGDRLFGAYILYDKHFFVSDSQVFETLNSSRMYIYYLKNDSYYMTYNTGRIAAGKYAYTLTLRTGSTIYDTIAGDVTSNITPKNDNLCSNGVVHHLVNGLIRPNQAEKKK